ncbi:DUF4160 domain-containing protein [Nocardioides sp. CGMCC 1.13656]|nr:MULTISPECIES: DUF4160 domain-containing protein [unclassified Nocardioides]MBA2953308.1 DUF4160 domain-containing protein [Nocardioides sp. CGMCC 1.13656]
MSSEEQLTPRERAARAIFTKADWDREVAAGRLTAQDVADRLWRMAVHEFGDEDSDRAAAYDDDGFFLSLTAASVAEVDGVKLWICTADHDPPHVHIKRPGVRDKVDDIKINLETNEIEGELPRGVRSKQLKKIRALVSEHHEALCSTWTTYHGTDVSLPDDPSAR